MAIYVEFLDTGWRFRSLAKENNHSTYVLVDQSRARVATASSPMSSNTLEPELALRQQKLPYAPLPIFLTPFTKDPL
jgi:hypothetical protein